MTELAKAEDLPVKFLEQVMQQLREAGYVASVRGKHGGYRLGKPAAQIVQTRLQDIRDAHRAPAASGTGGFARVMAATRLKSR